MKQINKYISPELVVFEKDLSVYTASTVTDPSGYPDVPGSDGAGSTERPTRPTRPGSAGNKSAGINEYNPFE